MGYYKNLAIEREELAMGIRPKNGKITYVKQNIADVQFGIVAHGCNYWGVMGAGVAKVLADKYPKCFTEYAMWLRDNYTERSESLGKMNIVQINDTLWIANCITQGLGQGQLATPKSIAESLEMAFQEAAREDVPLYLPKIGAGLGGLDWDKDVEPIVSSLATLYADVDTYVCIYPKWEKCERD